MRCRSVLRNGKGGDGTALSESQELQLRWRPMIDEDARVPASIRLTRLTLDESDLRDKLLPRIIKQVFHVTTRSGWCGIKGSGVIKPSGDGTVEPAFQYRNSFGRRNGYVCLFDLRTASDAQIADALDVRFNFLDPWGRGNDPVFLIFGPESYRELIPWTVARDERSGSMFIWYVEGWYPGPIQIELLSQVIELKVLRPAESEFEQALRARIR